MRDKNGWTGAPRFLFQPVKGGFRILQELTLFGEIDRVQTAIDRLRMLAPNAEANHPGGLMVCDSGGKDSDVIKELGLGVWDVVNLLEGYGQDNPGANAHGIEADTNTIL